MKKGVAVLTERDHISNTIRFEVDGERAFIDLGSSVIPGIDLLATAKDGDRFTVEYNFTPSGSGKTGALISNILGAA